MKTKQKVGMGLAVGAGLLMVAAPPSHAQGAKATGGTQQAGPFQVTLIAAPKVGQTRFETRVWRDGKPVTDARVTLNLSMPYMRHGATVERLQSQTSLDPTYAQYTGTAKLMPGTYRAVVSVRAGDDKGSAVYGFEARKTPPVAHLGMWHPAGGFEVRLTTDPEATTAQSGENRFRVQVTREGFPVTDADVSIHLTMPTMARMGSADAYAKLTPQNGAYEGTAKLHHAGGWRAHITVKSGGAKGTATYDFPAK